MLRRIRWCDTRDMTADGHTKGSIPRDGLLAVMRGLYGFTHPVKSYELRKAERTTTEAASWCTDVPAGDGGVTRGSAEVCGCPRRE